MIIKKLDFTPDSDSPVTMESTHAGIIPDRAQSDTAIADAPTMRIGIFRDEMPQNIITRVVNYQLDAVQLIGHESPTVIRNLRRTLDPDIRPGILFIKQVSVNTPADCAAYQDCVDYFVLQ